MRKRYASRRVSKAVVARVLLTETLPYELPLRFGNTGLYVRALQAVNEPTELLEKLGLVVRKAESRTLPLKFKISKGPSEYRELWVIHPRAQLQAMSVYRNYDLLVLSLCDRSEWSLRRPLAVGSRWYDSRLGVRVRTKTMRSTEPNLKVREKALASSSSYFSYGPFTSLARFERSADFMRFESSYRFLRKLDISNCFPSIYTHSIEWAVMGKEYAKKAKGDRTRTRFERVFDSLMQQANDGETAGIPVGPEFSRIFAEIILQRIDSVLAGDLHTVLNDGSLTIRRWVDDYYLFANSADILDLAEESLRKRLRDYNFRLSGEKRSNLTRPFMKRTEAAREEVTAALRVSARLARECCRTIRDPGRLGAGDEIEKALRKFQREARDEGRDALGRYRKVVREREVDYHDLSVAGLSAIRYVLATTPTPRNAMAVHATLLISLSVHATNLFNVALFILKTAPSVRACYLFSEIVFDLLRLVGELPMALRSDFNRLVASELHEILFSPHHRTAFCIAERVGMLVLLEMLDDVGRLKPDDALKLLGDLEEGERYFMTMGILHNIKARPEYSPVRARVVNAFVEHIEKDRDWWRNTEFTLMFCDLVVCTHLSVEDKRRIVRAGFKGHPIKSVQSNADVDKIVDAFGSHGSWFFDWDETVDVRELLRRKDLRNAY